MSNAGRDPLRDAAETQFANAPAAKAPARPTTDLRHELQVHQIELEMQNESLRQTQVALEESRDRYVDLYDFSPVGYLTLTDKALICEINLTGAALLGAERGKLLQRRFATFVAPEQRDDWQSLFRAALGHDGRRRGELTLVRRDGARLAVELDCLRVSSATAAPTVRVVLIDIRERKEAQARLRALAMELLMAEERERRGIAQDLHDDLGQTLAIAKLKLSSLSVPDTSEGHGRLMQQVQEIEAMIDRANRSLRSLSLQMSPPVLHQFGLVPALEWLAEEMQGAYDLRVRIHDDGKPKLLDEVVSSTLFRVVRELLINVSRHAGVDAADVSATMDGRRLTLTVADAGRGFDTRGGLAPSATGGYGLFSVRERIGFIGGRIRIDSRPGDGTVVELDVPFEVIKAGTEK